MLDDEPVDEETENWPVLPDFRTDLDVLKHNFEACPLPVFTHGHFVEPQEVTNRLSGALVEIRFSLTQCFIRNKNHHSFTATVNHIVILQPGAAPHVSVYKRFNPRDGPLRLNPAMPHEAGGESEVSFADADGSGMSQFVLL